MLLVEVNCRFGSNSREAACKHEVSQWKAGTVTTFPRGRHLFMPFVGKLQLSLVEIKGQWSHCLSTSEKSLNPEKTRVGRCQMLAMLRIVTFLLIE